MRTGWKFEVIYNTLQGKENQLNLSMLCEIAGVSRSGYYRWVNATAIREAKEMRDREDFELILKAYHQRGYPKGARGIYMCMISLESTCRNEFKENKTPYGQIWTVVSDQKSESI